MKRILVVAPHPDDETLGCGGTILWHRERGDEVHWLIVTSMTQELGYDDEQIKDRDEQIEAVSAEYDFAGCHRLSCPTTKLDEVGESRLVSLMGAVVESVKPNVVYGPFWGDVHGDHGSCFRALNACTKWFRYPSVESFLLYETLSETNFAASCLPAFNPNVFCDITNHLNRKVEIMNLFDSEIGDHPFPRSEDSIRALASLRGSSSGYHAAEAFVLVRHRLD